MQAIIIFFLDSIVPVSILGIIALTIYSAAADERKRPQYWPDQEVLGQNYKTRNGDYVKCKITGVTTIWRSATKWEHQYDCQVLDANITLVLNEDRVKPVI